MIYSTKKLEIHFKHEKLAKPTIEYKSMSYFIQISNDLVASANRNFTIAATPALANARQRHILLFQSAYLYARTLHVCMYNMCVQSMPRSAKSPHFDFYLPIDVCPSPGAAHRLPSYHRNRPTNDHK